MPNRLEPKHVFLPPTALMHGDGGNTGSTDFPGPLGVNITATGIKQSLGVILWGTDNALSGAYISTNPPGLAVGAFDANDLRILGSWMPPTNHTLNGAYMALIMQDGRDIVLASSLQGSIFLLERQNCRSGVQFELVRQIDLGSHLGPDETLLTTMADINHNVWFTTGTILGAGTSGPQNSTTLGYIEPGGKIFTRHLVGQVVENGVALSGDTLYVVTGPPGTSNKPAEGSLAAFTAIKGRGRGVRELWKLAYNAGSAMKPGGFARGSGSTPALLGDDFVVITDNDDSQLHLVVARQKPRLNHRRNRVCRVPIFSRNAGANDIRPTVHFDGQSYSIVVLNTYNGPLLFSGREPGFNINGAFNNMSGMPGGVVRVDVSLDGSKCRVRWTSDLTMKAVPILSTATGLLYGYVQDRELASQGKYVWYTVALDWQTGEEIWRVKVGGGGVFNDNFRAASLGPDGRFYQGVFGGTAIVKDKAY